MKTDIRLPGHFTLYGAGPIISNLEKKINYTLAERIKYKPYFAQYATWDYTGSVWWNDEWGYWCVEIWKYKQYAVTHLCGSLEALMNEVQEEHGYR